MRESRKEALRQDVRDLRAKGYPVSASQLAYLAKVANNPQVAEVWISRHGAPRDEHGERITERSWIELSFRYYGQWSWRANHRKTLRYTRAAS